MQLLSKDSGNDVNDGNDDARTGTQVEVDPD